MVCNGRDGGGCSANLKSFGSNREREGDKNGEGESEE